MMGALCFMVDGKICVCVEKDRLMVRLDPTVEAAALAQREVAAFSEISRCTSGSALLQ